MNELEEKEKQSSSASGADLQTNAEIWRRHATPHDGDRTGKRKKKRQPHKQESSSPRQSLIDARRWVLGVGSWLVIVRRRGLVGVGHRHRPHRLHLHRHRHLHFRHRRPVSGPDPYRLTLPRLLVVLLALLSRQE